MLDLLTRTRLGMRSTLVIAGHVFLLAALTGCARVQHQGDQSLAVIASLGSAPAAGVTNHATQGQIREDVVRFAQSYIGMLSQALDSIQLQAKTPDERVTVQQAKVAYGNALIDIATAPKPAANLLDMVVFATLLHTVVKEYWVTVYGPGSALLLETTKTGQTEIWSIADQVLSVEQRATLSTLIARWRAEHPKQVYVGEVRISTFAQEFGSEAVAPVENVSQLLPEVSEATRSLDEFRLLAERMLLFMQAAPTLIRMEAELAQDRFAAQPETRELIASIVAFSQAADRSQKLLETMPAAVAVERRAAIEQLMAAIAAERRQAITQTIGRFKSEETAFFANLKSSEQPSREFLGDLKHTMATAVELVADVNVTLNEFDRVARAVGLTSPQPLQFQITQYQNAAVDMSQAARNLTELMRESRGAVNTWIVLLTLAAAAIIVLTAAAIVASMLVYRRLVKAWNI